MKFLSPDSDFMNAVSRIVDYIIINLLCVLFSVPVITAGAAFTAKFYVAMKIERGEEPKVWSSFVKSFRDNFKQTTIIWSIILFTGAIIAWDWYSILWGDSKGMFFAGKIIFLVMTVVWWSVAYNIFPFIARFEMSTKEALKGALAFTFLNPHKMLVILIATVLPYIIEAWYIEWALAIWLLCTTATLYYVAKMYVMEFGKIEEKQFTAQEI